MVIYADTSPSWQAIALVLALFLLALPLFLLALPVYAQDAGPPCAVLLAAERADHAADLERLAAELRRVEAAVAEVPDPPSRTVWLAAGVGVGVLLVLGASQVAE